MRDKPYHLYSFIDFDIDILFFHLGVFFEGKGDIVIDIHTIKKRTKLKRKSNLFTQIQKFDVTFLPDINSFDKDMPRGGF